MGASFFVEAASGVSYSWQSFVTQQRPEELPPGWRMDRNNIAVFMSSEDEFVAVGDSWRNPLYPGQFEGLEQIISALRGNDRAHLYVRLHPNQSSMRDSPKVQRLRSLREPHVTVIEPTSPVSTYTLMRQSERVLSFGSTTGIEATYWGKPSILASVSLYDELGANYTPRTHEELIGLLLQPGLPPLSKEGALMYGFFARTGGAKFRYFQPQGLGGGPFRGVAVRPSMAARVVARALPFKRSLSSLHAWWLERGLSSTLLTARS